MSLAEMKPAEARHNNEGTLLVDRHFRLYVVAGRCLLAGCFLSAIMYSAAATVLVVIIPLS